MKAYSHGNKQKIDLIQAMMHRPEPGVLDEPTTGLDRLGQQSLYELIEEVKHDGRRVILLLTHSARDGAALRPRGQRS